jgi:hypothetical protein
MKLRFFMKTSYFKSEERYKCRVQTKTIAMPYSATVDNALLQQWHMSRLEPKAVEMELESRGVDRETITEYLDAYRKFKIEKKQFVGFFCMGLGAFLGFISCVLSLINPIPELYNVILFGLTSVAILIIVVGMYFLFE